MNRVKWPLLDFLFLCPHSTGSTEGGCPTSAVVIGRMRIFGTAPLFITSYDRQLRSCRKCARRHIFTVCACAKTGFRMRGQYFYHIRTVRVVQVLCEVSIKVLADVTLAHSDDKQMRFFLLFQVLQMNFSTKWTMNALSVISSKLILNIVMINSFFRWVSLLTRSV